MKYTILIILAGLMVCACNNPNTCRINGQTANPALEGKWVVLEKGGGKRSVIIDSALIRNGKYSFKGIHVEKPGEVTLRIIKNHVYLLVADFILENGRISVCTDSSGDSRITGTVSNNQLQAYDDNIRDVIARKDQIPGWRDSIEQLTFRFVKNNINNLAGQTKLGWVKDLPYEKLNELLLAANAQTRELPVVKDIALRADALERTRPGQPFVDLRMWGPDGKETALSDYAGKGKYVLMDFWASWCGPCRRELPHVLDIYKKYRDKGFEIVGISFDSERDAWLKGIREWNMPWPQMSDLKKWKSDGVTLYCVHAIPHTVLIDPQGIILARDLRGEALSRKLIEIFGY